MIYFLLRQIFWLVKSLLVYFLLVVALTFASRAYKIIYGRRNKRPVDGSQAVLVTGATSGIGLAVSKHLYKLGYSLIVCYYNNSEAGYGELIQMRDKQQKQSSKSNNGDKRQQMIFVELDVKNQQSISDAFETCTKALEKNNISLYALINNAGLGSLQPFAWFSRASIRSLVETNLLGSLLMTREFLPLLVKSKGRLVNVSSGLAFIQGSSYTTYGLTKSAQIYLTRAMNLESRQLNYGIKSIAVIPHNFVKNTNICSNNVRTNNSSWSEARPIERQLYKSQYDEFSKLALALEEATELRTKLANEQHQSDTEMTTATKDGSKGRRQPKKTRPSAVSFFNRLMDMIRGMLEGENAALTLEQSGMLECFEDAIRLEDPPEHIFAGDNTYNLLTGSLLLSMPASCINLLFRSVSQGIFSCTVSDRESTRSAPATLAPPEIGSSEDISEENRHYNRKEPCQSQNTLSLVT